MTFSKGINFMVTYNVSLENKVVLVTGAAGFIGANLLNRPIKNLFYVFGFGWCGDGPESVYVVPARELYDYDKDTRRITFPIKETEKEKMSRLERFKKGYSVNVSKK